MRRLAAAVLPVVLAVCADAWPVLSGARATPVGACYPDHRQSGLWWLSPALPVIADAGARPAISLTQYRYLGTRATGDQGAFWGRSVLQAAVRFPGGSERAARARAALGGRATVQLVRPTRLTAEVVFAPVEGEGSGRALGSASTVEPGTAGEGGGSTWEERAFALSLSPESTRVVWEAFERGAVALSISVVAAAPAFPMPPDGERAAVTPAEVPLAVGSVPVTIDPATYPDFARQLDLDATLSAGYTFLEVACLDLGEDATAFADLAVVLVGVTARAVNGDAVTEELRFDARSPSQQVVSFDRAVRLDAGYTVSVHRVYASGRRDTEAPRHVEAGSGFLDVSTRRPGDRAAPDPRLYY